MDAQQELFTRLKLNIEALGYAVYDTLPPDDTTYPFVHFGDFRQSDRDTKSQRYGFVYPTIHVWHNNVGQRGMVSRILQEIKNLCKKLERTPNFVWDVRNLNTRIIIDTTTATPLLHGILEGDWFFS